MIGKAEAALKQLASLSKSLNEASDQLNRQIAEIESALNAYKLGISAWVDLNRETQQTAGSDGKSYKLTRVEQLGYGKHNGKWGLLVCTFHEEFIDADYPGESDITLLRDTPRDTRLAAIDKIPDLLAALSDNAAKVTDEVLKKAAATKEIVSATPRKPR